MFWRKLFKKKVEKPKELRMYVLVRQDLDETYRIVQGAHAVAEYALRGYDSRTPIYSGAFQGWNNQTIVFLGVWNYRALQEWEVKLMDANKTFAEFKEPDLDEQITAIACVDTGEIFKNLPLAG